MLVIYTSPGCASCRKAKQWLKEKEIPYVEKNIFATLLKENEIKYLLSRTENGIDDVISKRSKVIKDSNIDIDEMSVSELIKFVQENPSTLKRPIIIDEDSILIGYDDEEIEIFDSNHQKLRYSCKCNEADCPNYGVCGKTLR